MTSADDEYLDADAPISDEEIAAAAVVLATTHGPALDSALQRRCESDARAYFDARRKVKPTTTTSGTEVVIEDDAGAPVALHRKRRLWTAGWLAAAACVGLFVFFARSRPLPPSAPPPAATAPMDVTSIVSVRPDGDVDVRGLPRCAPGSRYVLAASDGDAGTSRALATFTETPFRHPAGEVASGTELVVRLEREGGEPTIVGRWQGRGR